MKSTPLSLWLTVVMAFCITATALAENTDPLNAQSQYGYSEAAGWINAEPRGNGGPGVTVFTDRLEGYLWSENLGWINLFPTAYGGVTHDGNGALGGHAWSENAGWINFSPSGGGVSIDIFTGKFSGWGWGENIGWVNFDLTTQVQAAARTSWSIWEEDGDPARNWNTDVDGDTLVNLDDPDADNDGLANDAEFTLWGGQWNTDFDVDGLYNLIDTDADGDGLLDGSDPYAAIAIGDINANHAVSLDDAICGLKLMAGIPMDPPGPSLGADADNDGRLGLSEATFALQKTAGLR